MKIELKKIQINLQFSEETIMFKAEIYVNGINAGYASNDGRGGSTDYRPHYSEDKSMVKLNQELIAMAEKHCLALPPIKFKSGLPGKEFGTIKMNLEHFIDEIIDAQLKKKEEKKLEKLCSHAILYGLPKGTSYRIIDFKRPLKEIASTPVGKITIQRHYDAAKAKLQKGEMFFNKNLEELGIKL